MPTPWVRGNGTTYIRFPMGAYLTSANNGLNLPEITIADNLYSQAEYNQNYSNGYNAGRTQGQADVKSNPGGYGLEAGGSYNKGYQAGKENALHSLSYMHTNTLRCSNGSMTYTNHDGKRTLVTFVGSVDNGSWSGDGDRRTELHVGTSGTVVSQNNWNQHWEEHIHHNGSEHWSSGGAGGYDGVVLLEAGQSIWVSCYTTGMANPGGSSMTLVVLSPTS